MQHACRVDAKFLGEDLEEEISASLAGVADKDLPKEASEWEEQRRNVAEIAASCEAASQRWFRMDKIWKDEDSEPSETTDRDAIKALLLEGFARFQERHQNEQDLLKTGKFATTLSSIISRLPAFQTLCLLDVASEANEAKEERQERRWADVFLNDAQFLDFLSAPMPLGTSMYEINARTFADTPSAILLCDIPVALARANVSLRHLRISGFPGPQDLQLLDPANCALAGTDDELQAALSSLEMFRFAPMRIEVSIEERLPIKDHHYVVEYIKRCITSKSLRDFWLYLGKLEYRDDGNRDAFYADLGDALSYLGSTLLKSVVIQAVCTTSSALLNVFKRLSDDTVTCLFDCI